MTLASPTPPLRASLCGPMGACSPITLGKLILDVQQAAPSRLYWAGRPAMRFVQSLHWLRDMLPSDDGRILKRLVAILKDPDHGLAIQQDLRSGLSASPTGCA